MSSSCCFRPAFRTETEPSGDTLELQGKPAYHTFLVLPFIIHLPVSHGPIRNSPESTPDRSLVATSHQVVVHRHQLLSQNVAVVTMCKSRDKSLTWPELHFTLASCCSLAADVMSQ